MASVAALWASSKVSALAPWSLDFRKSTVPAMRVLRWSVGKRVMAWMPDLPAVSASQLSLRPMPSEVTTPMPVTATIGRPW